MKKLSSYFFAVVVTAIFTSCGSDGTEGGVGSSCSLEGNWKVKSAEVSGEKMDKTILELTKEGMVKYTYDFTADSVTINTHGTVGFYKGVYKLDAATNSLSMNMLSASGMALNYKLDILGCNGELVTVSNSNPGDASGASAMKSTIVLERVK